MTFKKQIKISTCFKSSFENILLLFVSILSNKSFCFDRVKLICPFCSCSIHFLSFLFWKEGEKKKKLKLNISLSSIYKSFVELFVFDMLCRCWNLWFSIRNIYVIGTTHGKNKKKTSNIKYDFKGLSFFPQLCVMRIFFFNFILNISNWIYNLNFFE